MIQRLLMIFSLLLVNSCNSKATPTKVTDSSEVNSIKKPKLKGEFGKGKLLCRIDISEGNVLSKVSEYNIHIPSDYKVNNGILYCLSRLENKIIEISLTTGEEGDFNEINSVLSEYEGRPSSFDISEDLFVVQLKFGILLYNRNTKNKIYIENGEDNLFKIVGNSVFCLGSDYVIREYGSVDGDFQLEKSFKVEEGLYSSISFYDKNLILFNGLDNILYKYSITDGRLNNVSDFIKNNVKGYDYLYNEDSMNDELFFLGYRERELIVLSINISTNKMEQIRLNDSGIQNISLHEKIEGDLCTRGRQICTDLRSSNEGILICYIFEGSLFVYKFAEQ